MPSLAAPQGQCAGPGSWPLASLPASPSATLTACTNARACTGARACTSSSSSSSSPSSSHSPSPLPPSSTLDFFQSDIVEYGSRYNRPDRFPRPRQAGRGQRATDVAQWLEALAGCAPGMGFMGLEGQGRQESLPAPPAPGCDQVLVGPQWAERGRELLLLTQQGRLDEAFRAAEGWGLSSALEAEAGAGAGADKSSSDCSGRLQHGRVLLAAVDAGDVALAFEYAGLLPPRMPFYTLLMGAYAVRRDPQAVQLALDTALRRRVAPDAMAFAVSAAAAALVGDKGQALAAFAQAQERGLWGSTSEEEAWSRLSTFVSQYM